MDTENRRFTASPSSLDSFEINMKQIEQTNKLLAGIESKLSDFFKKNDNPGTTHSITFEKEDRPQLEDKEDDFRGRFIPEKEEHSLELGRRSLSPHNKDSQVRIQTLESKELTRPSRYINVVENPKTQEPLTPYGQDQRPSYLRENPVQQFRPSSLNTRSPESPYKVTLQDTNLLNTKAFFTEREKFDRVEDTLLGTHAFRIEDTPSGSAFVDKMNKLEEFYQNKIRILEERLATSEKESQTLLKLNETLNMEITRLKKEIGENKTKFVEDINRSLREQEERLRREYETSYRAKEKAFEESQRQSERYLETIDELKNERLRLNDEIAHLKNLHQMTLDEKDQLHRQYQSLLNIHNQMLQLDIQKNEKNLKDSMSFTSNIDSRNTINRNQESENIRLLVDTINSYKKELEYLKENNILIQKQFTFEIQRLKEDLRSQREENTRLNEKLTRSRSPQTQERSPIAQRSPSQRSPYAHKRTDVSNVSNFEVLRDDELYGLEKTELTNYARMVRDSYLDLQERHKQQLMYNRALQLNLKELGQKSKEDCEKLNEAYSQVFEANELKPLGSTYPTTLETYGSRELKRDFPLTNAQLKATFETTKEKKERKFKDNQSSNI